MNLPKSTPAAATVIGGLLLCMALNVNLAYWKGDILVAQAIVVQSSPAPSFCGGKYAAAPRISGELKHRRRVTFDSEGLQTSDHATVRKT